MLNLFHEENLFKQGHKIIGALDEAGRGPLAGPVVAACVVFNEEGLKKVKAKMAEIGEGVSLRDINDSKKVTAKKRDELFDLIKESFEYGIGICDHETIDRVNILEATFLAMKKALSAVKSKPDYIILDGKFPIKNLSIKQEPIIGGDGKIFSIAAASILAKVTRDRLMEEMHLAFPEYGFDQHKGYGTKLHMERLKEFGACPIHRRSFAPVRGL